MRRPSFSLKTMLSLVTLATVLGTAWLVHVPWYYTSMSNVHDTIAQLNGQTVGSVSKEVKGTLDNAAAALQSLRTILQKRVVSVTNPEKREFLFLAYLQSHPAISWVAFGWPNGDFFGAHKVDERHIEMVESTWDAATRTARRRIDHYEVRGGDLRFTGREFRDARFYAPAQPWYHMAMDGPKGDWTDVHTLPLSGQPGISISTRLSLPEGFVGVIDVSIALDRLSLFLKTLHVGASGTVFIVDGKNELVASGDSAEMPHPMPEDQPPKLMSFTGTTDPPVALASAALAAHGLAVRKLHTLRTFTQHDAHDGSDYFVSFAPLGFFDWTLVTVVPARDFLATIDRNLHYLMVLLPVFVAVVILAAIVLSRAAIARPLARITGQMQRIEDFQLGGVQPVPSRIREIAGMSAAIVRMARGLAAFQRYLPTALVRTLIAQGMEARPQSKTATILFTDIEGFTAIGERMTPEALVALLNEYFSVVTPPIERHGGVITQIQGDAILAVYNVPNDDPGHAANALHSAMEIQRLLADRAFTGGERVRTRVGINTGPVVAGSVGSPERVNYTVHGDAVNVAARLEALNKEYGTRILVSQSTADLLGGAFALTRVADAAVRGKQTAVTVYTVAA